MINKKEKLAFNFNLLETDVQESNRWRRDQKDITHSQFELTLSRSEISSPRRGEWVDLGYAWRIG